MYLSCSCGVINWTTPLQSLTSDYVFVFWCFLYAYILHFILELKSDFLIRKLLETGSNFIVKTQFQYVCSSVIYLNVAKSLLCQNS